MLDLYAVIIKDLGFLNLGSSAMMHIHCMHSNSPGPLHRGDWGTQPGEVGANMKLRLLTVLLAIKSFVSEPGVSCLLQHP